MKMGGLISKQLMRYIHLAVWNNNQIVTTRDLIDFKERILDEWFTRGYLSSGENILRETSITHRVAEYYARILVEQVIYEQLRDIILWIYQPQSQEEWLEAINNYLFDETNIFDYYMTNNIIDIENIYELLCYVKIIKKNE